MKAIDRPYTKIINGTTQFMIPVFQRDYKWTEAQCLQLWRDIIQAAGDDSSRGHFIGSIVYISTGDSSAGFTRWLLIDGQQRITTLTLLLAALRDHILETGWIGKENDPTAKRVEAYFLKNLQEEGDREHKLVLRRHDQATLQAILDKVELPAEKSERVVENYDLFRDQIKDSDPATIYLGIGRLIVVDVTLDRLTDDPQLIFESLNSTGMDLSQSDLIRNYILMGLPEAEQTRLYGQYWNKIETLFRGSENTFDSFARDFMALKTKASKQEKASEIYQSFRVFFKGTTSSMDELENGLSEMLRFARYHAAFSTGASIWENLSDPLARLRRLVEIPAILVMRLFDCFDRLETLSESQFITALSLIEGYVVRRAICGSQTRGYWQIFANLAYKITDENPLEDLMVGLARQRDNYRYPSDDEFYRELQERELYGLRVCRHLLERLENHGSLEITDTSQYSIEHILPQNEKLLPEWREMLGDNWRESHQKWLHRLGNLTLTGYNSKYSDRLFTEKKTIEGGFADSSVRLNKFVREQEKWTQEEIEKRGKILADRAMKIWPTLDVSEELIEAANQKDLINLAARRDVGKVKMSETAEGLFRTLQDYVSQIGSDIIELAESKSVSYHGPVFFMEVLPRKHKLNITLPLDFNEIEDPTGLAEDATQWKFFLNAQYDGGVVLQIRRTEDISAAMPIIRQAYSIAGS